MCRRILFLLFLYPVICQSQVRLVEKKIKLDGETALAFEKYQFANGLTLILHRDNSNPLVAVNVTYKVGSANDVENKSGMAHFFEHLMFQGSKNVGNDEHMKLVTQVGGRANGQTFQDKTVFSNLVPRHELSKVLWLESDRMGYFLDSFTSDKFNREKKTILNERKQGVDNVAFNKVNEISSYFFYPPSHPYQAPVIGLANEIENITFEDLVDFYNKWYNPRNAILVIAGDIEIKETISLVDKYFGNLPGRKDHSSDHSSHSYQRKQNDVLMTDKIITQPLLWIKFPSVNKYQKDWVEMECLSYIMGYDNDSYLKKHLANSKELTTVLAYNYSMNLGGEFNIVTMAKPNTDILPVKKLILKLLEDFNTIPDSVLKREIKKFRQMKEFRKIYEIETLEGRVFNLIEYEINTGKADFFQEELEQYEQVTPSAVMRVFKKYIRPMEAFSVRATHSDTSAINEISYNRIQKYSTVKKGGSSQAAVDRRHVDSVNRKLMPRTKNTSECYQGSAYSLQKLNNGAKIISHYSDAIPVISLSVNIQLADKASDDSTAMLSKILGKLIAESNTRAHTNNQFNELLKARGMYFNVGAGENTINIQIKSLKKYWKDVALILEEKIFNCNFDTALFNAKLARTAQENSPKLSDPVASANNYFHALLFSVFRESTYPECISNKYVLEDVQDLYKSIRGDMLEVVISGDATEDEIVSNLKFLEKLRPEGYRSVRNKMIDTSSSPGVYIVNAPNSGQMIIRVGCIVDKPLDLADTVYKFGLANFIFGGHFNSRLNSSLREKYGYTYKAYSYFTSNRSFSRFFIETSVNSENLAKAINAIFTELTSFRKTGVTSEELAFVRQSVQNREFINSEGTANKIKDLSAVMDANDFGDFKQKQCQVLSAINTKEMNGIIDQLINIEKMKILIVGDVTKIEDELSKVNVKLDKKRVYGN